MGLFSKYVGEQFLGNIDSPLSKLEAYITQDINIQYKMTPNWCETLQLQLLLNNILDKKYVSNGYFYTYDDDWSNPGSITTIEGGRVLSSGRISFFDWNDNKLLIIDKH